MAYKISSGGSVSGGYSASVIETMYIFGVSFIGSLVLVRKWPLPVERKILGFSEKKNKLN